MIRNSESAAGSIITQLGPKLLESPDAQQQATYQQLLVAFTLGRWLRSSDALLVAANEDEAGVRRLMAEHFDEDVMERAERSHAYWRTAVLGFFDKALQVMAFVNRIELFRWVSKIDPILYVAMVSRMSPVQPSEVFALVFHTRAESEAGEPIVFEGVTGLRQQSAEIRSEEQSSPQHRVPA